MKTKINNVMGRDFCRYAVWDIETGVMLVCGEKYRFFDELEFVECFRCLRSHFKKVYAYARHATIKGRNVDIVYWFNTPKHSPFRVVQDGGRILGLR